jgi:hypothetical protein
MGREAAFSGNDPTDSVRAVNAVLTQLDKIKRWILIEYDQLRYRSENLNTDKEGPSGAGVVTG